MVQMTNQPAVYIVRATPGETDFKVRFMYTRQLSTLPNRSMLINPLAVI